jgi:hypothetical protein
MTMRNEEERFEMDLRAALAPEPASPALRQRILVQAVQENRKAKSGWSGWLAALDPRSWRLLEMGALAAAASLAIGIFAGASGLMPDSSTTATTTLASNDGGTVDLVALAYDDSSSVVSGDLQ